MINSADMREAKQQAEAFAAAHRIIEARLHRVVRPAEVGFVDDRLDNVLAARRFGWPAAHAV